MVRMRGIMRRTLLVAAMAAAGAGGIQQACHAEPLAASALLVDAKNITVGNAKFEETPAGVLITVTIQRLPPGAYALHIHEKGLPRPTDFEAAGKHFAPAGREHGFRTPRGPHAGDLPNLHVGQDGSLQVEILAPGVTLKPGRPNSLLRPGGTSLIIHETPDDYVSQPSGGSGARIAGGTIQDATGSAQ